VRWVAVALGLALCALTVAAVWPAEHVRRASTIGSHRPAWELRPTVPATFLQQSYAPGESARLVLWRAEPSLTVQLFRVAPALPGWDRTTMCGTAVSRVYRFGPTPAHRPLALRVGDWPSGVYFARLRAAGLTGFAPLVVRPRRLGVRRVLVVEPTFTWQAYNFRDDDDDGRGDTWYDSSAVRTVRLDRPFLARGVPPHFLTYDLPFLRWLAQTARQADVVSDEDLDTAPAAALARYGLVAFPGHEEYVTPRMYELVQRYRDGGGHLVFLSADNFFWRVVRHGSRITRTERWRDLGRPEAALVGVQFLRNDRGLHQGPWRVATTRLPWLFAGTGLAVGSPFGTGGIEIDHVAPSSPRGAVVVARIPNLMGRGYTADMTYYRTPAGGEVFAAGAFTLAASGDATSWRVVANLWRHMVR
jgi:hypothetical protein